MAILEAMGYGRGVVATRVGAIPELITDGQEGFLVEPGDIPSLAGRLVRLASEPDLLHRMALPPGNAWRKTTALIAWSRELRSYTRTYGQEPANRERVAIMGVVECS